MSVRLRPLFGHQLILIAISIHRNVRYERKKTESPDCSVRNVPKDDYYDSSGKFIETDDLGYNC